MEKEKAGDTGQNRKQQEPGGPAGAAAVCDPIRKHHQTGDDGDQGDQNMQQGEPIHAKNHELLRMGLTLGNGTDYPAILTPRPVPRQGPCQRA